MTKTIIATDSNGYVTISYNDVMTEDRIVRTFFCPVDGGYVKESIENYPQVCEKLTNRGSTLHCNSRDNLINVIRREYYAMRRAEKRESNRY